MKRLPERIVFFLSTSRTGTKALANGLAGGDISSLHQPPFSRLLTVCSNYYLQGWLSRRCLEWMVGATRERQIAASRHPYYIQVFALDFFPAKIISLKYPDVHIVHIIRDPRTFVPSYLNWMHTRPKSYVANKVIFGWHPSGYFTGEFSWRQWRQMDVFQRVCWHWAYKNTLLEKLFATHENYRRIRFEDLFLSGGVATLRNLLAYVGLPYHDRFASIVAEKQNVSRKTRFPPWDAMTARRRRQLLTICGRKMKHYGYG